MEGTYSLIGRSAREDAMGVVVATAAFAVGKRVPHALYGVGAVATQGRTDTSYASRGIALLKLGVAPEHALPLLTAEDADSKYRQAIMMDWYGRSAVHTGNETDAERADAIGRDCIAAGNTLHSPSVPTVMIESFQERSELRLADRLMAALRAGTAAGGDRRGATSAALLVVSGADSQERMGPTIDLRVDDHSDPVAELDRLLLGYYRWKADYLQRLGK